MARCKKDFSLMARCTAYFNTMDALVDYEAIEYMTDVNNVRFQALCYSDFGEKLHEFLQYRLIDCNDTCTIYFSKHFTEVVCSLVGCFHRKIPYLICFIHDCVGLFSSLYWPVIYF